MAHTKQCAAKVDLVNNNALHISYCGCGLINLHMGPISLRISETAFAGFADAVNGAMARLHQLKHGSPHNPVSGVMGDGRYISG